MEIHFSSNIDNKSNSVIHNMCFYRIDDDKNLTFIGLPDELKTSLMKACNNRPIIKSFWIEHNGVWFYLIALSAQDPTTSAENFFAAIKDQDLKQVRVYLWDMDSEWIKQFYLRIELQNYNFTKYLSTGHPELKKAFLIESLTLITGTVVDLTEQKHLSSSILWARDLSNEPSNICTTTWLAQNVCDSFAGLAVEISVLDKEELEKIGMNALLGVGKGSIHSSKVVIIKYLNGHDAPVVLLGKGVCFDSGGISLKPASNMGDMKSDMSGAGIVAASIRALVLNKAKVNVIGLLGIVENMPDAGAQKPGDIVKTLSGQTVEIINTDAEGRLVLADLMWYAQDQFKPKCMVDLATLTGAIVVALGTKYAGLFSNNDTLAKELIQAGITSDDLLWRMPMCEEFDRLIDSKVADLDNSGPRYAGSSTAAHFIARFNNNLPWAHLDIAGTAFLDKATRKSPYIGGTGFGVHLIYTWLSNPVKLG